MSYKILTRESVLEYVRGHPLFDTVFDPGVALESEEIGDGNLNLVFRVLERGGERSVLVKQALPYLRVAGEGWPLSKARAGFEARALEQQHRAAPGRVPRPLWFDEEMAVNAMEDLRGYVVIRAPMVARVQFPELGYTVGRFLANTLFATSDFALPSAEKKWLSAQFSNLELCELSEALIFTEPFYAALSRNRYSSALEATVQSLWADAGLRAQVAHLKLRFMTYTQALLHGDLHTGSLMATLPDAQGQCDIRVIDPEFAFFGPMGFDVGLFFANLLLNAVAQGGHAPDLLERQTYRRYLLEQLALCWRSFESGFLERFKAATSPSWLEPEFQKSFLHSVFQDSMGYAGCEMIRRTIGFAHVLDLDSIPDELERIRAERKALELGRALIGAHRDIESIAALERLLLNHLQLEHLQLENVSHEVSP